MCVILNMTILNDIQKFFAPPRAKFGRKVETKASTKKDAKLEKVGYFFGSKGYGYHQAYKKTLPDGKYKKVDKNGRTIKTPVFKTRATAEKESMKRFALLKKKDPTKKKERFQV
jgi:hypothetical protein